MIGSDVRNLDALHALGTRCIQLTYNSRNLVGDGCTERTNAGLSDFGVEVVHRMNDLGIIVDLSHCGEQTTLDGLTLSRRPGENQGFYAERLEVEPITLCRMVDRLEEAGMIERRRDPTDRRAWHLHLTPKSRQVLELLQESVDSLVKDMLGGLTSAEQTEFARLMHAVGANLAARREMARTAHG